MALSIEQQQNWLPASIGEPPKSALRPQGQEVAFSEPTETGSDDVFSFFGDDGFSFGDLVDIVNPLQHIPLVSTVYRETTGDEISAGPRIMGSTLFFGPLGLASAVANVVVEENTGKDIGQHMASWADAPEEDTAPGVNAIAGMQPQINSLDANDPVVSWARQEIEWARKGKATSSAEPKSKATSAAFPDAERWVQQQQPWALNELETNTAALNLQANAKSATRAYELAQSLEFESRG